MRDIVKWVVNNKQNGLEPNEQVLAAVGVAPKGAIERRMKGVLLGGALGAGIAEKKRKNYKNNPVDLLRSQNFPRGIYTSHSPTLG